ncbi:carbohydrate ABC transporter permease [Meiothermus granaticius]|uniref:Inner membrane ABC transporter permease protein YcjP n=1 Tax=Meiothermus granaticius NBRC 107808 TaxID=1227551 RepID=A0A399F8A1_9DEIN|nr:carbohydrate ABC transporter permease [Meiothermus granaticius]MCL6527774.1 carbohydrate ABC transporter permease [Thermaceae bacterium]RIH91896.1 Inner membrane ABC transporter permease protein YcjP [Meiothermus granaticius NBRC 107808]GEM85484.1 ABC transporter permease [Meiothermus granaticius NBRC 107808]
MKTLLRLGRIVALALYALFAIFPLYWVLKIAFTPDRELFSHAVRYWPENLTLANFAFVLHNTNFPAYFRASLVVSLSTALIATLLATATGYAFSRFNFRGKPGVMLLLLTTQMFPLVLLIAPLYRIFAELHLLNTWLGLILIYTAFNVPFAAFLMQNFFDGIPQELEEAARIDGCTRFQALLRVVLPLTLPGLVATIGFVFVGAWAELLFALMFINSDNLKTFPVGLLFFISKFNVDWGNMTAAAALGLIPVLVFFALIQRYLIGGLTTGATKG